MEFALLSPVLMLLIMGVADTGFGLVRKLQVQSAAQAGAQHAAIHGFSLSGIGTVVGASSSLIAADPQPLQFCGCASVTDVGEVSCSSTCPGGQTAGSYVRVFASSNYRPFFPYPFVGESVALSSQATLRLR